MVVLLSHVVDRHPTRRERVMKVFANFESDRSIGVLIEHVRRHVPGLVGLNTADCDWRSRIGCRRVFNYTYAFGLFEESVRPTLVLEADGVDYLGAPHSTAASTWCSSRLTRSPASAWRWSPTGRMTC